MTSTCCYLKYCCTLPQKLSAKVMVLWFFEVAFFRKRSRMRRNTGRVRKGLEKAWRRYSAGVLETLPRLRPKMLSLTNQFQSKELI